MMARAKEFSEADVLTKAMFTFWEQGYEKTSMQDLVTRMGIHRRSIYDTFGDKHRLFLKVLDHYENQLAETIQQRLKSVNSAKEKLQALFSISLSSNLRGCLIVNTATELSLLDEEVAVKIQASLAKSEAFIYEILKEEQEKEGNRNNRNLQELASYLHNAWVGLRVLTKTTNDQEKLGTIINTTLSVL